MIDGARNALLGYLYQFLVVSSLRVWADAPEVGTSSGSPLRTLLVNGRLTSEKFNQDMVIEPDTGDRPVCAAVQVKHSDSGDEINLQAFTEMLYGFDQSRQLAAAESQNVGSYWVVTNRPLHLAVRQLWTTKDTAELTQQLDSVRGRGKMGGPSQWLRTLLGKYGTKSEAYTAWGNVLAWLQPVVAIRPEVSAERLRTHLREYGVLADGIDPAIGKLLVALVVDTADGKRAVIDREYLKLHLIGAKDARFAKFDRSHGMEAVARVKLGEQLKECSGCLPVRRELMKSLREQVERHPVTVVYGDGGCGKSVLTLQRLLESGAVALSVHAREATERHVSGQLKRLRSETQSYRLPDDSLDTAIERLRMANPTAEVVLVVDIDAIDELRLQDRGEVHELVRSWLTGRLARSGAKLVVSCRPEQPGERGLQLILSALTGMSFDSARNQVGIVFVGDFTEDELAEAANNLNGTPEQRLLGSGVFSMSEGAVFGGRGRPVSLPIVESLRHPVVWGAYATLSPAVRNQVLEGDPHGTTRLAISLLDRFLGKCVSRGNHGWEISRLEQALRLVARTTTSPPFGLQEVWVAGCAELLGSDGARLLYREALTYGLVVEDEGRRWRWRHSFLAQYLLREDS